MGQPLSSWLPFASFRKALALADRHGAAQRAKRSTLEFKDSFIQSKKSTLVKQKRQLANESCMVLNNLILGEESIQSYSPIRTFPSSLLTSQDGLSDQREALRQWSEESQVCVQSCELQPRSSLSFTAMSLIMPGHQGPVSAAEVVDCQLIICCFSTLRLLCLTFPSLLLSSADWEHFSSCWGFQLCPSLGVLATFSSHYLHGSHATFFLPGRRHKRSLGFWHTISANCGHAAASFQIPYSP